MSARRSAEPEGEWGEVVSRVFAAPRDLVFEVWTSAEHFVQWFGPHEAEIFDCEIDARPGGVIRFAHRFPGSAALRSDGTFTEVIPGERLVFGVGFVDEAGRRVRHPMFPSWPADLMIEMRITFHDVAKGTRVEIAHRVSPPEAMSHPETKRWAPMAVEGSKQVLERLGQHLERSSL